MNPRLPLLLAIAAIAAAPLLLPDYYVTLMNYIGLASLVTLGLVLLTGVAGLTSFGQAAFVGLGAYATAVVTTKYGGSPWLGLAVGLTLTAVVALFLGFITLRLSDQYLPLGTIAWGISHLFCLWQHGVPGSAHGHTRNSAALAVWLDHRHGVAVVPGDLAGRGAGSACRPQFAGFARRAGHPYAERPHQDGGELRHRHRTG